MAIFNKMTFRYSGKILYRLLITFLLALSPYSNISAQIHDYDKQAIDSLYALAGTAKPEKRASIFLEIALYSNVPTNELITLLDSAIQLATISKKQDLLYKAYFRKSEAFFFISNLDSAYVTLKKAKTLITKHDNKKEAETDIMTGQLLFKSDQADSSKLMIEGGLKKLSEINDSLWVSEAWLKLGLFYIKCNENKKAIEVYQNALRYGLSKQTKYFRYNCYANLGLLFSRINDYEKSLENLLLALQYIDEKSAKTARVYTSIGIVYGRLKIPEKALEYFVKAKDIFEQAKDTKSLIGIYSNIGSAYSLTKDFRNALTNYKRASLLMEQAGHEAQQIPVLVNIASIYLDDNQPDSALFFLQKAEQNPFARKDRRNYAYIMEKKGGALLLTGFPAKAIRCFDEAFQIATEISDNPLRQITLEKLSQAYQDMGDYKSALLNYQDAMVLKDSIESNEHKIAVEELISKYNVEVKEKENRILQQDLTISQDKVSKQRSTNIIISLISIFLLFGLLITAYIIRLRNTALFHAKEVNEANAKIYEQDIRINEQERILAEEQNKLLNAELDFQKKRVKQTTRDILKNSEISSRLLHEMEEIKPYCNNQNSQRMINKTLADFSGLSADNNWENFYAEFTTLYPDFFPKLDMLGVELTETERRMAAFIKMGMPTNDIAPITFQSINTINVSKTRLKNKLNFATSEDMYEYLEDL